MNRKELKDLIKECIVEILTTGIGQQLVENKITHVQKQKVVQKQPINKNLGNIVKTAARGNSVMNDILADTAANTLQKQLSADRPSMLNGDSYVSQPLVEHQETANSSFEDIFGDAPNKWAELAFASPKSKSQSFD